MFEQWCIVEIFGHQIIAGRVSEQMIGGQSFVRVDVPEAEGIPGFTKFYGPGAIYAMTPTDEATVLKAVAGLRVKPIEPYKLNIPQLAEKVRTHDPDDYDEDDGLPDSLIGEQAERKLKGIPDDFGDDGQDIYRNHRDIDY